MSVGSINDFDNEEPSTLPPRLPPPPEFPDGEFTLEEQAARQPPPRDPRPEPRVQPTPVPADWKPATAIGGECSDLSLLPARFERFASETEQALKTLAEGMKQITECVLPMIALQGKRIDEGHREQIELANRVDRNDARDDRQDERIDELELELTAANNRITELETDVSTLRKRQLKARQRARKPTKAQRPTKRAGRKNVR